MERKKLFFGLLILTASSGVVLEVFAQSDEADSVVRNATQMILQGRRTFRFDTFADESFWGDELKLHQAIAGAKFGGVGPGVSPNTALAVGLKIDVEALPHALIAAYGIDERRIDVVPLGAGAHSWAADAWNGGVMQALSHAFAKAAMFLAAGLIAEAIGHDRIAELRGVGRAMPMTVFAFGLGGLSLMGLPPSGGFTAKWLLLKAAVGSGQWPWAVVMLAGGLLAGGYIYRVLAPALADGSVFLKAPVQRCREAAALALALVATLLGFAPPAFFEVLQIGSSATTGGLQ
jgi:hypothetical protein